MKSITVFLLSLLLTVQSLFAGGLVLVAPEHSKWNPGDVRPIQPIRPPNPVPIPDFTPVPLEVKSEKVTVEIHNDFAITHIDQVFFNPTRNRLQGYFLLPMPKDAVISDFSMYINGKEMPAELLDAPKARKIYEDIVRKAQDPALLEYNQQGLFKARIFPIEPESEKRIKISYTQALTADGGLTEYIYPLHIQKSAAKPIGELSIQVGVQCGGNDQLKTLYCPTHEIETVRQSAKATASYEATNVLPDSDFKIYFNCGGSGTDISWLTFQEGKEDGYFLLNITPDATPQAAEITSKDITFVLDISGSMAGEKLDKAKEALLFCVHNLNKNDRFNIVRFSTEARTLFEDLEVANSENVEAAQDFIKKLRAVGGTNIDEALEKALRFKKRPNHPYFVVFITDGKPTIGVTAEKDILKKMEASNPENTRIFTFGIGEDINTHLLDKITESTQAYRSYILPNEDIELKISNFYTKISSPVLTDLKLDFGRVIAVSDIYPKELPDLFSGSTLTILGRYRNYGNNSAHITLTGKVNGKTHTQKFTAYPTKTTHDFVAELWASRAVGYLLDQIRLHGEDKELVDEVVRLAKQYGIITPYTSYLILEDEQSLTSRPNQPRPMPQPRIFEKNRGGEMDEVIQEEYGSMQQKSGGKSIRSSSEIQNLNKADNIAQTKQGQSRMNYHDTNGNAQNIAQQYRNVQGRAIYQTSANNWVDTEVLNHPTAKTNRIQFASKDYFDLANNQPEVASFLAVSRNVQFYWEGEIYEVYD